MLKLHLTALSSHFEVLVYRHMSGGRSLPGGSGNGGVAEGLGISPVSFTSGAGSLGPLEFVTQALLTQRLNVIAGFKNANLEDNGTSVPVWRGC